MSEVATNTPTAIEPVNATATGTVPVEEGGRATSPMEKSFEDVISRLNKKHAAPERGEKSLSDIVQRVEDEAKGKAPAAKEFAADRGKPATQRSVQAVPKPGDGETDPDGEANKPAETKEKYKVGDQEYELSREQAKRFTQKGIALEKRVIDIQKAERQAQEWQAQKAQEEQQKQQFFAQLAEDPGQTLEKLFGPEIFEKMKPWAAGRVQKEMEYEANPHLAAIEQERQARAAAEAKLQQYEQQQQQQQIQQESAKLEQTFSKLIMDSLQESGIPRTDFTAAEMATHIDRAASRGIDYTPQQLAQIVREDNTVRIRALTDGFTSQIAEARKNNDMNSIVGIGEQVVEMFGEPLMYAMAKYHLAKLQRGQPTQPKQVLDTPKAQTQPERKGWGENGKQYMSEDKYAEMRRKIARGEIQPPPGW